MSYTYPEALDALEGVAKDMIKVLRPHGVPMQVSVSCSSMATTASVVWDSAMALARIELPVRPAASRMTQSEFEDWTSYLLHELGHPTHTDWNEWTLAVRAGLGSLTNALEDVRMEQALIASGKVRNAKSVLSRIVSRKIIETRNEGYRPNARKSIGWTIAVLGRASNAYAIEASDLAWIKASINPAGTVAGVLAWALPELAKCTSTKDCRELAAKIDQAIAKPDVQGPQGQDQGQDGEGEGEGEGEGKSEGQQGQQGQQGENAQAFDRQSQQQQPSQGAGKPQDASNDETAPDDAPADETPQQPSQGHGNGKASDEKPVTSEKQLDTASLAPETANRLKGHEAQQAANVIHILRSARPNARPRDFTGGQKVAPRRVQNLRDAAAKASGQRALLARALRANETDERDHGRRSGRLDRRALPQAMAGAQNVFGKRDISEGFDTDVHVLLDASGSMGGPSMEQATRVGLVIAQAAASVGAACTVEAFSSAGHMRAGGIASKRAPNVETFARYLDAANGGTPLSVNIARVSLAQAMRAPGKRRVVFIVTDGGCDHGPVTVKNIADYLTKTHGTIFAHVSIANPLTGQFKAEVMLRSGQDITEIGLGHFVRVLQAL